MLRLFKIVVCFFCLLHTAQAQSKSAEVNSKKGVLYFGFGSNLSFYSHSDISFRTGTSDFTLYNVKAEDDRGLRFHHEGAPQYSYQLGYYFKNKNFGVEFNFDHIKYFAVHNQVVRVTGTVNGEKINTDTAITAFVQNFEHSDGANYALFNFVKWKSLYASSTQKSQLNFVWKAGAGPVIPKTNSTIMGRHYDDQYRVSGYVVALEAGVRYTFLKHLYIAPALKGAYANYSKFIIRDGFGHQKWFGAHFTVLVGAQVNL